MSQEDTDTSLHCMDDDATSKFTYRDLRLLSQYSTSSPLRVIALIDFDCFYAQCERVRLGLPEGRPLGVQQFKHVIATNYEARAAGLKKVVTAVEARRLCPDIVLQHVPTWREGDTTWRYRDDAIDHMSEDKSSLDYYRLQSRKAIDLVKEFLPSAPLQKVEKASIDEIFIDLSAHVHRTLLARFPDLLTAPNGDLDRSLPGPVTDLLDWHNDKLVVSDASDEWPLKIDWDDVAINIGASIVRNIRSHIREQLHYTCSAGVARNKTLAKLAAGHNKPNMQTVVRTASITHFLSGYKFTKLRGMGGKLGQRITQAFSTDELSQLLRVPLKSLQHELGADSGSWVFRVIRGFENSEVTPRTLIQSMLSAKTFEPGLQTLAQAEKWLQIFSADIIGRLEEQEGRRPKVVAVQHHIRGRFGPTRSKQAQIPVAARLDVQSLSNLAREILVDITRHGEAWPCWSLSMSVTDFFDTERSSHSITSMFAVQNSLSTTRPNLSPVERSDVIQSNRRKAQKRTIQDFRGFDSQIAETSFDLGLEEARGSKKQCVITPKASDRGQPDEMEPSLAGNSGYHCPTCTVIIPAEAVLEHLDWHVALDLQNSG